MKIYNYHRTTGEFISVSDADKDPLEPHKFLIPAYATELLPPSFGEDQIACFKDGNWIVEDDLRGLEFWLEDGSHHMISEIGEGLPENASLTKIDPLQELLNGPRRKGAFREFMALFTKDEQVRLKSAEQNDLEVAIWFDLARGGPDMSLDHPHVAEGLAYMVANELLTQERADEIADTDFNA